MENKKKRIILLILAAAILLAALTGWFFSTHIFIGGAVYAKNAAVLDLQGKAVTAQEYEQLRAALPEAEIIWDVPFQGGTVSSRTKELTVDTLTEEDLALISCFTELQTVHAENCRDYPQLTTLKELLPQADIRCTVTVDGQICTPETDSLTIRAITDDELELLAFLPELKQIDATACADTAQLMKLRKLLPDCKLIYNVTIAGTSVSSDATELSLTGAEPKEVLEKLAWLPEIASVRLPNVQPDGESLTSLPVTYPNVDFYWDMEVLGVTVTSQDTQVDFSNIPMESVDAVEAAMACFPDVETVLLCECGIDNDTMATYRDRARQEYKVVWTLHLGKMVVRSDATYFMPAKNKEYVTDEQMNLLRYCEDMICVDVGHYNIIHCEWAAYMPKLKYLIIADAPLIDVSPLANLKELIYLELFVTPLTDVSPLLNLTQLEDLNLSFTWVDPEPVMQMTWLKRLWWAGCPFDTEAIQASLPNTETMFQRVSSTGFGWREGQNYYDMRDILGMHYMVG